MIRSILYARGQLRPGWRLARFVACVAIAVIVTMRVLSAIPATAALLDRVQRTPVDPAAILVVEAIAAALVVGITALAVRLEGRTLADVGLPRCVLRRFGGGAVWGVAMMSVVVGITWASGGLSLAASPSSVSTIAVRGGEWAVAYLLVALLEEVLFRGYALATLGEAIGPRRAAVALAVLFGAVHLGHDNLAGALDVVIYALFATLTLWRTGNLWFAIGLHAAWNFSQTYLFGLPTSGLRGDGSLLVASVHGPAWLTGGAVGPEGSAVASAVVVASALVFSRWYAPARR